MKKNKVTFEMPPLGKQYAKQAVNKQTQQINNPITKEFATERITQVINQSGMPPQMFAEMGQLAEAAIYDKKQYQRFVDYMVKHRLEKAEDLKKPDYQMLASLVVIGKVAETMGAGEPTQPMPPEQMAPTQGM